MFVSTMTSDSKTFFLAKTQSAHYLPAANRDSHQKYSMKKVLLKFRKTHRNTLCRSLFLKTPTQVFSYDFAKFSRAPLS